MSRVARGLRVQVTGGNVSAAGRGLLTVTSLLVGFGLVSVYSASSFVAHADGLPDSHYLIGQLSRATLGGLCLAVASMVDYRVYRRVAWPLLVLSILLLLPLLLPGTEAIAPRLNGARRWLRVGLTFQPSELAKIAVVIWTASLAVKKQEKLKEFKKGLLPFLLVIGLVTMLVLLEPHMSAAMIIAASSGVILFAAGCRLRHVAALLVAAVPLVWYQIAGTGYRASRVAAFLDPGSGSSGVGYQLQQSLIAVGSGGLLGVGFGQSSQKLAYLPEPQNDFIFAIIAEEWGLLGSAIVIGMFVVWSMLALRIAREAPDPFGRLLATGIAALVFIAAFGHMGVTLGVLPTTGVNLPFVSAGGTNLVLMLGATGILTNISMRRRW